MPALAMALAMMEPPATGLVSVLRAMMVQVILAAPNVFPALIWLKIARSASPAILAKGALLPAQG